MTKSSTPNYTAPEIDGTRDAPGWSKASDIFSLGMVMYEILVQQIPFENVADRLLIRQMYQKGSRPTIPLESNCKWANLVQECWRQDKIKRPNADYVYHKLGSMLYCTHTANKHPVSYIFPKHYVAIGVAVPSAIALLVYLYRFLFRAKGASGVVKPAYNAIWTGPYNGSFVKQHI